MMVEIREEELKKLKNKVLNYRQVIRTHEKNKQASQAKAAFNDTEKLIILEGVLLQVLDTRDQSPVTKLVLAKFNDDKLWEKLKNDSIEKIIQALKMSVMN